MNGIEKRFVRRYQTKSGVQRGTLPYIVRRQSYWDKGLGKLREALAHRFGECQAACRRCCKRRLAMVCRLILSRSARIFDARPK